MISAQTKPRERATDLECAGLTALWFDRYESGVEPPHSKNNRAVSIARFAGSWE